jgi:hypothetical protein
MAIYVLVHGAGGVGWAGILSRPSFGTAATGPSLRTSRRRHALALSDYTDAVVDAVEAVGPSTPLAVVAGVGTPLPAGLVELRVSEFRT